MSSSVYIPTTENKALKLRPQPFKFYSPQPRWYKGVIKGFVQIDGDQYRHIKGIDNPKYDNPGILIEIRREKGLNADCQIVVADNDGYYLASYVNDEFGRLSGVGSGIQPMFPIPEQVVRCIVENGYKRLIRIFPKKDGTTNWILDDPSRRRMGQQTGYWMTRTP